MAQTRLPNWFKRKLGRIYFVVSNEDSTGEIRRTVQVVNTPNG